MTNNIKQSVLKYFCILAFLGSNTAFSSTSKQEFSLRFDPISHTLISMIPDNSKDQVDFLPYANLAKRTGNGFYQLGDIDIRLRLQGQKAWQDYSSALQYNKVTVTPHSDPNGLFVADITADLPGIPLKVTRAWQQERDKLTLTFTLTNPNDQAVEVGGLGLAMVFDNIVTGRDLKQAHEQASYAEPYIGKDAGYVQVVRLNGKGPALLVMPEKNAQLENWMPILDEKQTDGSPKMFNDPTNRTHTFEGFYDWMVFSKGFAENEWQQAEQWNTPSAKILTPNETFKVSLRFVPVPSVREIENTLIAHKKPVAIGLPGYVVPTDLPADLFVHSPTQISSIQVYPKGALNVSTLINKDNWQHLKISGRQWGRSRLNITYRDGSEQSIHYFVTEPMKVAVNKMGKFLFNQQWYEGLNDPFKRGPSIMSYDNETGSIIEQEQRVWIAGLSDEGGAGAWLAGIMKQLGQADAKELEKFERFYTQVIDGRLQINHGPNKYGVKKSLFYYDPKALPDYPYNPDVDWTTWASWDEKSANSVVRSFNYPHVAAAQWVLYRLARFQHGLVKAHDWRWYLERAFNTSVAMVELAPHYAEFGQMEGDVFVAIVKDLYAEGMTNEAQELEDIMRKRAEHWASLAYPFGSEMPWDSTGQEEVYAWMRYFDKTPQAEMTRDVILGYDFTLPHWGYNGSARRFWDFLYAGKYSRIERQLHHYGSTINAMPLLDSFHRNPNDFYLLRVAYGGMMGGLTNIHQNGFASAAFHSFPDSMKFDPYSGDYGSSFFGHAFAITSYLVQHLEFGWLGFGGTVKEDTNTISLQPKDAFQTRVYIAPAKLWLTLDAGKFSAVSYNTENKSIVLSFAAQTQYAPKAILSIQPYGQTYAPNVNVSQKVGRYQIPLSNQETEITLVIK